MAVNGEVVLEELSNDDDQGVQEVALLQTFLRGHPKTLGAIELFIGGVLFMFGVEMTIQPHTLSAQSGFNFWGGLMFVSAGALSIAANTKLTEILVKASMGMHILCMHSAVIGIVLLSLDLSYFVKQCIHFAHMDFPSFATRSVSVTVILLILTLGELLIALYLCVWAFKATCSSRHLPKIQFVSDPCGQTSSTTENSTQAQGSLVMVNDHPHEEL
ncbi:membrane-spanning 4-domains subfamily A member 4A-like [Engraulis encrasicolus]|uniref:membrane-spanning 4-domains subfamily A member 4A-like n=1 Tax=Engraulis encrasicolus TaxID=184585 RepID=UPI002FCEE410